MVNITEGINQAAILTNAMPDSNEAAKPAAKRAKYGN
jgi:hypothetical protein